MTVPNTLTDEAAVRRNRARATALFLQEQAADEVQDRLSMVNRSFTRPAVVTPFPSVWAKRLPDAELCQDQETLALAEGAHDLVIHAMGLHWSNDPVGQLIQCRRALKPDGLLIAACLGGQTLQELRVALAAAEVAVLGGLSPRIAPMAEIRDLGALLQRAGLALPVADSLTLRVDYRDAWHLMQDLRAMGEGNALTARRRHPVPRQLFQKTAQEYAALHTTPEGRVRATYEMVFLTGWAPDASQQQPLRPGSAKQRLAEALAVPETRLPD
ncbi:methyltransferase domain-containing protein [uncultured Roseobacter sp.]|uniref:methyltransferase domain-containing protein n=1 Tax=uncultured Roseobacter sp. TaxID=114847 RepID=UPI00260B300A|nr:methyltransferase domain-containing protein [uncultured Roseobacter sp.]